MMPLVCLSCPVLRSAMPTSQRLSVYDHVLQKKKVREAWHYIHEL